MNFVNIKKNKNYEKIICLILRKVLDLNLFGRKPFRDIFAPSIHVIKAANPFV